VRQIAAIHALGGIFIPSVCVVDLERFAEALTSDAASAGAQLLFGSEVLAISLEGSTYIVHTSNGNLRTRIVINSGGLAANRISAMAGFAEHAIEFIRGAYYEGIGGVDRWNIRTLIYPAMPRHSRSKGIHFGPRTDGRLYLGPSATVASGEPASKDVFLSAARSFVPEIQEQDLRWAYAGVRPKLPALNGRPSDFLIRLERAAPAFINLIGIDSPGLSASMAIARHVGKMALLESLVL